MPQYRSKDMQSALLAGLLSSALFLLVYGAGLGFIFMFVPTLPLFFAGLQHNPNIAIRAAAGAATLILLFISPSSSVIYMFLLGVPSWYLTRCLLQARIARDGTRQWFPVGLAITNLSFYAVAFIGFITAFYASEPGGLPALLSQHISESLKSLEQEYGEAISILAREWSFLIFPITVWLWAICLYFHAWFANRALASRQRALRASVAVTPFTMPGWVLYLLAVAALASLIGSDSMRFFGKSAFIILMLPYFFSGIALIHHATASWPSRRLLLFFIYIAIFAQVWPALAIAAAGIWQQLKTLNKHLPRGGSSSNN